MIKGRTFYSRRVYVLHGLLLVVVLAVSYYSVRAQYEALRDGRIEEARTDQQLTTRVAALTLQNQFLLFQRNLIDYDRERPVSQLTPTGWTAALAITNPRGGGFDVRYGSAEPFTRLLAEKPWMAETKVPVAVMTAEGRIALAVPQRRGGRVVMALVAGDQVAQDTQAVTQRNGPAATALSAPALVGYSGRILASSVGTSLGKVVTDCVAPSLAPTVETMVASANPDSRLFDDGDTTLVAVQPVIVTPGVKWCVASVRTGLAEQVSQELRPLFWQMLSQTAVMMLAAAAVLVSTTLSLHRGRRRIETLRTDMINRDLAKARRIQLSWLPAPVFDGANVKIAAENRPALHISGDFYNWFDLPGSEEDRTHKTAIVIGDVSGHGVPAAFLMANTQMLVRSTLPTVRDPAACLEAVNRQICNLVTSGQFVTMMILVFDHDTSGLEIASAGHHAPLLRRDGRVELLAIDTQLVVGVDDTVEYQTQRFRTRPGDTFLLYTDGAIEMSNPAGEQFRIDRLEQSFAAASELPQEAVADVSRALDAFRKEVEAEDDLTLLAVQVIASGVETDESNDQSLAASGA